MANDVLEYIGRQTPNAQEILENIRLRVKNKAPNANEKISYGIPSFHNKTIIIYYAAFKNHFSIFPPIKGDDELLEAVKPFANEKGNLIFKYKKPIPWDIIDRVIDRLIYENLVRKTDKV